MKYLLWFLFSLLAGLYITGPVVDPDLWWHIVAGRWILANGTVPNMDYWNMFGVSKPWLAYSWSNEILFAFVESQWGINGLLLLKSLVAVALALTFSSVFSRIAKDNFIGGLLGFYTTVATFNHFTLRPQSLTWIFFALLIYLGDRIVREGANKKSLALLFIILVLWANTHLTAILGLITLLFWVYPLNRTAKKKTAQKNQVTLLIPIILVGLIALFITPYMGGEVVTLFTKADHPFSYSSIAEFQAAQINHYSTAFLIIVLVTALSFLHKKPDAVPIPKLLIVFAFTIAALAVVKFMPLAVILISALVATIWSKFRDTPEQLGKLGEGLFKLKEFYNRYLCGNGLAVLLLAAIFLQIVRIQKIPLSLEHTPVGAVDYIIENSLSTPILNLFGDGGYLMYRFSDEKGTPKILVPIDGRTNVNSPDIMRMHGVALRGQSGWREYIDTVNPSTILWRRESPLTSILEILPEWDVVYTDGTEKRGYIVFVRRGKEINRHFPKTTTKEDLS